MAASQASGSTQCSTSPWCQTWDSLEPAGYSGSWNFTGSGRILDLPFRRLGGQNVEDDCRCVILVRLPAEPLHEVSERGGLHTSDLFRGVRSEEHTSELQSRENLVCRLLLEKK